MKLATASDMRAIVSQFVELAAKLLRETERLRRDVRTLNGRITGFDDEVPQQEPSSPDRPIRWPVTDALDMIKEARRSIVACEHELAAIRARMDAIEKMSSPREEMKP